MKFEIERTSDFKRTKAPCANAINTGRTDGMGRQIWEIEIPTLEALIALSKEVECELGVVEGEIEIIDDYRE